MIDPNVGFDIDEPDDCLDNRLLALLSGRWRPPQCAPSILEPHVIVKGLVSGDSGDAIARRFGDSAVRLTFRLRPGKRNARDAICLLNVIAVCRPRGGRSAAMALARDAAWACAEEEVRALAAYVAAKYGLDQPLIEVVSAALAEARTTAGRLGLIRIMFDYNPEVALIRVTSLCSELGSDSNDFVLLAMNFAIIRRQGYAKALSEWIHEIVTGHPRDATICKHRYCLTSDQRQNIAQRLFDGPYSATAEHAEPYSMASAVALAAWLSPHRVTDLLSAKFLLLLAGGYRTVGRAETLSLLSRLSQALCLSVGRSWAVISEDECRHVSWHSIDALGGTGGELLVVSGKATLCESCDDQELALLSATASYDLVLLSDRRVITEAACQ